MADKRLVLDTVDDLVSDFLYYDRKEDEDLPRGKIEELIKKGVITKKEIINQFIKSLTEGLDGN